MATVLAECKRQGCDRSRMPRLAPAGQQRQACRALNRVPYLLGEGEIADGREPALTGRLDSVETYNPARYRGGILQLHYARAQELGPWLDSWLSGVRLWCSSGSSWARRQ